MIDFGHDQICYVPGPNAYVGSVNERSWDQFDTESQGRYSRPRLLGDAHVSLLTPRAGHNAYILRCDWPKYPELRIEVSTRDAVICYEV